MSLEAFRSVRRRRSLRGVAASDLDDRLFARDVWAEFFRFDRRKGAACRLPARSAWASFSFSSTISAACASICLACSVFLLFEFQDSQSLLYEMFNQPVGFSRLFLTGETGDVLGDSFLLARSSPSLWLGFLPTRQAHLPTGLSLLLIAWRLNPSLAIPLSSYI